MKERPCNIKPENNENTTPVFSKEEVAKWISGTIAKIKSSKPGFEGYDFGYLYLNTACNGNRIAGTVETEIFEEILKENDIDVMCKICEHYLGPA